MSRPIVIACDHAALEFKNTIKEFCLARGLTVEDVGTHSEASCDYPEYAAKLCLRVLEANGLGILICGSGVGMSMTANRFRGIRAALCTNEYLARMSRQHNDANVLCLGARVIGIDLAKSIVDTFFAASFEGDRHQRRIDLIETVSD